MTKKEIKKAFTGSEVNMDVIKLNSIEETAKAMARELNIGCNITDHYEVSNRTIYLIRSGKTLEICIMDATTKEMLGNPIDGSICAGQYFKTTEMITELLKANLGF